MVKLSSHIVDYIYSLRTMQISMEIVLTTTYTLESILAEMIIILLETFAIVILIGLLVITERKMVQMASECRESILSSLKLKHSSMPCDKAFIVSYTGENGRSTHFINKRPLTMKGEY